MVAIGFAVVSGSAGSQLLRPRGVTTRNDRFDGSAEQGILGPTRLVSLLQRAAKRPKTPRSTKAKRAAKEKRLESKRQGNEVKSLRGRSDRVKSRARASVG